MSEEPTRFLEPIKRPLTDQEREVVVWLLEHSFKNTTDLLPQVERLTVASRCTCGCPTIDFALDGEPVNRKGEQLISDWLAEVDGAEVGVMLFQTNGKLSTLEVYSCAGSDKPFGLPSLESIKGY